MSAPAISALDVCVDLHPSVWLEIAYFGVKVEAQTPLQSRFWLS